MCVTPGKGKQNTARQGKAPGVSCFETSHSGSNRTAEISLISGFFSPPSKFPYSYLPQRNCPPRLLGCYRTLPMHNVILDMSGGQLYISAVWPAVCWQTTDQGRILPSSPSTRK